MVVSSAAESGAERHSLLLASSLQSLGVQTHVVCPPSPWMENYCRAHQLPISTFSIREKGAFRTAGFLRTLHRDQPFDLIHAHLTRAAYAALIAQLAIKVPAVASVHVVTKDPVYQWFARKASNRLIAVSGFIADLLRESGINHQKVEIVHNGTNFRTLAMERNLTRADLGLPENKVLIGLVGRVAEAKGHRHALQALKLIQPTAPNAHLVFLGREEGPFPQELRQEVAVLGLNQSVTFLGSRPDVAQVLDLLDFTTLPSLNESFGMVAIESMARGKPVVAFQTGGLVEVIEDGRSGLLTSQTSEDLALGWTKLVKDSALRSQMGEEAMKRVEENFSSEAMASKVLRLYQTLKNIPVGGTKK
ncbi:MAG: glycosyltransferase family 4 protein [Fimbriimonadaceae bacterium]|nr:glycosyltransferase family 4 protein [Fimbriimonadaceae bacterium]